VQVLNFKYSLTKEKCGLRKYASFLQQELLSLKNTEISVYLLYFEPRVGEIIIQRLLEHKEQICLAKIFMFQRCQTPAKVDGTQIYMIFLQSRDSCKVPIRNVFNDQMDESVLRANPAGPSKLILPIPPS
jgi:hypothetical protein